MQVKDNFSEYTQGLLLMVNDKCISFHIQQKEITAKALVVDIYGNIAGIYDTNVYRRVLYTMNSLVRLGKLRKEVLPNARKGFKYVYHVIQQETSQRKTA